MMIAMRQTTIDARFELKPGMHFHLVGIGGSGISAIAQVLLGRGYVVSGSDQQSNELTAALQAKGVTIYRGHQAENVIEADALVISSAIPSSNPEVVAAKAQGTPVLKRMDLLGHLMEGTIGIAVAGTHGKTTTSGMIAQILMAASLDPTVIVGGVLPSLGTNGRHGNGNYFVVEADEYDYMFLGLRPQLIIITNLEHDHPDVFPTMAEYTSAFADFVTLLPSDGRLVACVDNDGVTKLLDTLHLPDVTIIKYGVGTTSKQHKHAQYQALDCRPNPLGGMDFLVEENGRMVGLARLRVPGLHNVRNAMAAIIVAREYGIEFDLIRQALAGFGGIGRRFQVLGQVKGVTVIDDYAHHPTEIKVTLSAARQRYPGRRIWAVWQPHTYSRTKLLLDQFATSFDEADRVIVLDIYRSREKDDLGIDPTVILASMNHPNAVHLSGNGSAASYILDRIHPDDVILTLSAGDGNVVGQRVLESLKEREDEG